MMNKKVLGVLLATLLFSQNSLSAEINKDDETIKQLMKGLTASKDTKHNLDAEVLSKQLHAALEIMNDPDLIKANAKYMKNLYDALIDEGFSKEQALKLVSNPIAIAK
jgi:hypothetical protein